MTGPSMCTEILVELAHLIFGPKAADPGKYWSLRSNHISKLSRLKCYSTNGDQWSSYSAPPRCSYLLWSQRRVEAYLFSAAILKFPGPSPHSPVSHCIYFQRSKPRPPIFCSMDRIWQAYILNFVYSQSNFHLGL